MYNSVCSWLYVWWFNGRGSEAVRYVCVCAVCVCVCVGGGCDRLEKRLEQ